MKAVMSQQQGMHQVMRMAPQMLQSLEYLQLPWLELRQRVQEALATNPDLEELPAEGEGAWPAAEPLAAQGRVDDVDAQNDFEPDDYRRQMERLGEMLSRRGRREVSGMPHTTPDAEEKRQYFLNSITKPASLYSHLEEQLEESGLGEAEKAAGRQIIGNVDENGWLSAGLEEIARDSGQPLEVVERALAVVQDFDPPGVAARDLRECLLIQLRQAGAGEESVAARLVRDHLEDLGRPEATGLAAATGFSAAETAAAVEQIRRLAPKPGAGFSALPAMYVVPEVEIWRTAEGGYAVEMLREMMPRLRLSEEYLEMLENPETAADARTFLREKMNEGKFLLDSIERRQETIRGIAEAIAEAQGEFFEHGISHLKPMTMSDLAERLEVHPTTVGRAVADKYARTPQGVFELRKFFTAGLTTADGGSISKEAAKQAVRRLVTGENPAKPLSDQAMADRLKGEGLPIARRTVAKYREELGIPPAHQRKL